MKNSFLNLLVIITVLGGFEYCSIYISRAKPNGRRRCRQNGPRALVKSKNFS